MADETAPTAPATAPETAVDAILTIDQIRELAKTSADKAKTAMVRAYYAGDSAGRKQLCSAFPFLNQTFSAANHP